MANMESACRIDECGKPVAVKKARLCWAHYIRERRTGDAATPAQYIRGDHERRFWSKVDKDGPVPERRPDLGPCWLWTGTRRPAPYDYGLFTVGTGTRWQATRYLVQVINETPLEPSDEVCHHCDNPPCVNPAHLFVDKHLGNMQDMDAKGRCQRARGEESGTAKFTEQQVLAIRQLHRDGMGTYRLAKFYGVRLTTIQRIVKRVTWKHLP